MSAPAIIANMVRGWNCDPAGVALGTHRTGMSAAYWVSPDPGVVEVTAEPEPDHDIVILQTRCLSADWFLDDRVSHKGFFKAGDVSLVAAGSRPRAVMRGPFACLHIYVPRQTVDEFMQYEGPQLTTGQIDYRDLGRSRDEVVERIGYEILAEMRSREPLSRLRIDALGQEIAIQLLRRWSNLAGTLSEWREPTRGGLAPWQVRRTTEYMADNISEDIGVMKLAALAQLSTFHFARAFKRSVRMSPHHYQCRLRLERAQLLLTQSDLPVTEIAAMVGYDTPQTLARLFRRELGMNPSSYRRERKL